MIISTSVSEKSWREMTEMAEKYVGKTPLHSLAKGIREDSKNCAKYLEAF